ncbi:MAG: hypothetical protein Q9227_000590 [Pyrenula ochraceoflavens]
MSIIEPLEDVWRPAFSDIYEQLLQETPPLLPPSKPRSSPMNKQIAALSVHPTLEAILHILNLDLPSAHFLVRHMESAPAYEGMLIHGILHRIEGDYDNARAWYRDVKDSNIFLAVWKAEVQALGFVDEVENLKKNGVGDKEELQWRSLDEIKAVVSLCAKKFGTSRIEDASGAWVQSDERKKEKGANMIVGGEGWRHF